MMITKAVTHSFKNIFSGSRVLSVPNFKHLSNSIPEITKCWIQLILCIYTLLCLGKLESVT